MVVHFFSIQGVINFMILFNIAFTRPIFGNITKKDYGIHVASTSTMYLKGMHSTHVVWGGSLDIDFYNPSSGILDGFYSLHCFSRE